ncbi:MAG: nitrilase-related carbon-nitrogen hydrolase [Dehalococcoidia bacterium]
MGQSFTVALLQIRAYDLADHEQAWAELLRRIDDAAVESPRLIVAPEAAYPAGVLVSREAYTAAPLRGDAEVLATLGDRARRHGCYIAAGLVLRDAFGLPQNTAVLIAPGGAVIARAVESRGTAWSVAGAGPVTAAVDDTHIALFAGRDAADPVLVAATVEDGVRVLVDTGAATSWGRALDRLPESRAHVLLAARAVEHGAWGLAPGKVGVEAATRVYAGRAGVVSPAGAWVARAPSDRPGIVLHEIDLDAASGPPVAVRAETAGEAAAEPARAAAIAVAPTPSAVDLMEALRAVVRAAAAQGARLIVLPDLAGAETRAVTSAESLPLLEALSAETQTVVAVALAEREPSGGTTTKTMYLIDRGRTVASHRQSALSAAERAAGFAPGDAAPPVVATSHGAIGLLCGVEGLVPSIAAGLAARGATLLAWCTGDLGLPIETLARARAIETRRTVIAAGVAAPLGGGSVVDGRGTVVATTLEGRAMAALARLRD